MNLEPVSVNLEPVSVNMEPVSVNLETFSVEPTREPAPLEARIHRGAHEIGGNCVELRHGLRRMVDRLDEGVYLVQWPRPAGGAGPTPIQLLHD